MESAFRPDLYKRQSIVITGGATGIGFAIACAYATHGAKVHILSRNEERLKAASEKIGKLGLGGAHYHVADVRDSARINEVADEIGPIHVLINAAAGNFPTPFSAMSDNAWTSVIDIVLNGTAICTRAFGEPMKTAAEADGKARSIINIVAGYAWTGAPGVAHSGAAKAGVLNLTKSLAVEWAPHVRLNAVSPGPIAGTEGMRRLGEDLGLGPAVEASVPMGRMGEASEIADACLFLGSRAASYITGSCLPVDGGQDSVGPFGGLFQAMQG
jgi:NAD(P)-dependent dehydrogenase (short-subunit alcohol dehydrogenase family)